ILAERCGLDSRAFTKPPIRHPESLTGKESSAVFFTSPHLRGEVGSRSDPGEGALRLRLRLAKCPSPQPSPRMRGEGVRFRQPLCFASTTEVLKAADRISGQT